MNLYILSRPKFGWDDWNKFLTDEGIPIDGALTGTDFHAAEALVEASGRLCYMSYGKGRKTRKEFIDNLIQSGHHSVLEHANWSILISGISRSCSHELVRHRHFSFSQLSQRYCNHERSEPIVPPAIGSDPALEALWRRAMRAAFDAYRDLDIAMKDLPTKAHRTAARSVLPNATPTKIVVTGNCRAWREFIQKRNIDGADPEIRQLAQMVREALVGESEMLFGDLVP